jgi:phage-related protein
MGYELRRPEADYLRDEIYELRIKHEGVPYRILYFFHEGIAILSHGLQKEDTVPPREIDRAIQNKRKYIENPKLHTYEEEA